ncbi:dynein regulatory complex subunit 6-like [Perognathus longimembris pacificus]|uniref:dynein regulatory complex subunit 6-like n=1 Tax=Perognathus longimembris pacificus TaxID=214514 RepID=UPI002019FC65|nr:dynein regulatory complex subunit 6-like [Perognathus longimembris pacificus]
MFSIFRQKIFIAHWREETKRRIQVRETEMVLEHEMQLKTYRHMLKSRRTDGSDSTDSSSELLSLAFDISLLPERAILQIFLYLSFNDMLACGQVSHSWMSMTQISAMWTAVDFSTSKTISEKCIVFTLQKWRINVLHLNFRGFSFQAKTMRAVSHCKNLQELNVSDCPSLTDESMKYISEGCPGILYLNLSNTTITNKTMRLLSRNFQNLQNLSLAYCRKFTDKGLQYLGLGNGCHKLIYLDLSGCIQISVQGFRNIAESCSGIMHLIIHDMPTLTDRCVKVLVEKCLCITSVVFIGSPHISDCTFKELSTCPLQKIRCEGNRMITDACFKNIDRNHPNITHIYMVDCQGITDGGLKSLSLLKQLTVLNLANCVRIGDVGLQKFLDGPSSTKIRELNLSNCVLLGDASIVKLAERCPNLNYLSLRNCDHLTDQGLEYLVNIFSLISIDISGTVICNEGLSILSKHKRLKELSISACYKITDVGIQGFCKKAPFLEHLDVSHCAELTDDIMKTVAIYCAQLTSLNIAGCPKITDMGMEILSAKCHYLHILDISGCVLLTDQTLQDLQIGCSQLRILKMKYCSHISMREAQRMSSKVQQQEYSSSDPPRWFGYDSNGKPLRSRHGSLQLKGHCDMKVRESYSSEDETM